MEAAVVVLRFKKDFSGGRKEPHGCNTWSHFTLYVYDIINKKQFKICIQKLFTIFPFEHELNTVIFFRYYSISDGSPLLKLWNTMAPSLCSRSLSDCNTCAQQPYGGNSCSKLWAWKFYFPLNVLKLYSGPRVWLQSLQRPLSQKDPVQPLLDSLEIVKL